MPLLTFPLALAVVWRRSRQVGGDLLANCGNRFQRRVVSSLMLWQDQREARDGGLRVQRIQTPLLFFLEILALLLLAAQGRPRRRSTAPWTSGRW